MMNGNVVEESGKEEVEETLLQPAPAVLELEQAPMKKKSGIGAQSNSIATTTMLAAAAAQSEETDANIANEPFDPWVLTSSQNEQACDLTSSNLTNNSSAIDEAAVSPAEAAAAAAAALGSEFNSESSALRMMSAGASTGTGANGVGGSAAPHVSPAIGSVSALPSKEELAAEGMQSLLPPDGNWGWAIVIASFLCNVIVDGVCFSFGVMLPHMRDSFGASESVMSMGGSMLTGCYLLMGPVTSALANKFGCRVVTMVGSVISCAAFFISALFVRNIYVFIVIYGVIGGIGFGLIYLPAIVIVGFWFEKKRAFATGIAVCGSGIGTFVFAPLSEVVINTFSWRGGLIIIAAIVLNCAIAGSLFTPLDVFYKIQSLKPKKAVKKKVVEQKRSLIFQKILEEKERQRTTSQGSLDGWLITGNNQLIPEPEDYNDNPILSTNAINRIAENVLKRQSRSRSRSRNTSLNEQLRLRNNFPQLIKDYAHSQTPNNEHMDPLLIGVNSNDPDLGSLPAEARVAASAPHSEAPSACSSQYASHVSLDPYTERKALEEHKQEITKQVIKEISRPMNRKDVFYVSNGSLMHIPEYQRIHSASYKSASNVQSYIRSVTSLPAEQQAGAPSSPVKSAIKQMLDLSIILSPTFLLLLISSVFTMIGFLPVYMFIKNYAISHNVDDSKATWLVSVIGITNTVGRVIAGWVSDRPWASCLAINNVALIVSGVATAFLPFFNGYPLMVIYTVMFGLFIAAFVSLRSILVVELMGLDRLTNAFGLLLLFQGFGMIAGPPLAAAVGTKETHYRWSFYLAGGCLALSGILCIPLKIISNWEKRRDARREALELKKQKTSKMRVTQPAASTEQEIVPPVVEQEAPVLVPSYSEYSLENAVESVI